jgi:signal transduction histidine kinase
MKRFWLVWIGFSLCVVLTAAAMTWMTCAVVRLDRAEAEARRQAALEANVRLALWRADATLAPLVTQESLAPWVAYRPILPNRQPSPFLAAATPHVLVHFQFDSGGRITSPEVPPPDQLKLAPAGSISADRIRAAEKQLARVAALTTREQLAAALPKPPPELATGVAAAPANQWSQQRVLLQSANAGGGLSPPQNQLSQQRGADRGRGQMAQTPAQQAQTEFNARNNTIFNNGYGGNFVNFDDSQMLGNGNLLVTADVRGVPMTPLWVDENLILARHVAAAGHGYVQGCLVDLADLRALLADAVGDLLPDATFEPVPPSATVDPARMLAALPLRIVPGEFPAEAATGLSPMLLSLAVAWACMLATAATVACLLAGIIRLSNRRASFVTAVTHELRTPLTTFQMYVEMLAEGMVRDEEQSRHYLKTLQAEAARLTHMVENVLAYARLERGRADGRVESITLGQLLDRVQGRLIERAQPAGMEIVVAGEPSARQQCVQANVSAVEQILFNLVDNACKYAVVADDKRIHVELRSLVAGGEIRVCDHGPGLPPSRRKRWFHSFSKSAQEAAHSAPGIGLGLALSRRLARHTGGELRLECGEGPGACFVLTLKTACPTQS